MSRQLNVERCVRRSAADSERLETVMVGGGQAGLSVGYHLSKLDRPFVILDANERSGDSWRKRWNSLRLFTPARLNGLPGWPFPAPAWSFPTKDEMADYLEAATRPIGLGLWALFTLPITLSGDASHPGHLLRFRRANS
jgi:cation diffusion facilitator CzcD-associated flavoprotein CzcO